MYRVTVENHYGDDDTLKFSFNSNTILLHEASREAEMQVIERRMNEGKDYTQRPSFSRVTYQPDKIGLLGRIIG